LTGNSINIFPLLSREISSYSTAPSLSRRGSNRKNRKRIYSSPLRLYGRCLSMSAF
jgi:hypothetical protein